MPPRLPYKKLAAADPQLATIIAAFGPNGLTNERDNDPDDHYGALLRSITTVCRELDLLQPQS